MASPKEVKTAEGIIAGLKPSEAMRAANYSESYVRSGGEGMVDRLRAKGLLPSEEAIKEAGEAATAHFKEKALEVAKATVRSAIEGNAASQKIALDRGAGVLPKRHEVSMEDVGAVVDDLLTDAARELEPEAYERLRQAWAKRIEERKRP